MIVLAPSASESIFLGAIAYRSFEILELIHTRTYLENVRTGNAFLHVVAVTKVRYKYKVP